MEAVIDRISGKLGPKWVLLITKLKFLTPRRRYDIESRYSDTQVTGRAVVFKNCGLDCIREWMQTPSLRALDDGAKVKRLLYEIGRIDDFKRIVEEITSSEGIDLSEESFLQMSGSPHTPEGREQTDIEFSIRSERNRRSGLSQSDESRHTHSTPSAGATTLSYEGDRASLDSRPHHLDRRLHPVSQVMPCEGGNGEVVRRKEGRSEQSARTTTEGGFNWSGEVDVRTSSKKPTDSAPSEGLRDDGLAAENRREVTGHHPPLGGARQPSVASVEATGSANLHPPLSGARQPSVASVEGTGGANHHLPSGAGVRQPSVEVSGNANHRPPLSGSSVEITGPPLSGSSAEVTGHHLLLSGARQESLNDLSCSGSGGSACSITATAGSHDSGVFGVVIRMKELRHKYAILDVSQRLPEPKWKAIGERLRLEDAFLSDLVRECIEERYYLMLKEWVELSDGGVTFAHLYDLLVEAEEESASLVLEERLQSKGRVLLGAIQQDL